MPVVKLACVRAIPIKNTFIISIVTMKRIILFYVALFICINLSAYEKKDLLQKQVNQQDIKNVLIQNQKWVKYPSYSNREGWDRLMGENKPYFIEQGEKYLDYQWQVVKASDYLEFSKSGSRVIMEKPFNNNLSAISSLFLAEMAEGKGRFMDQLINGIFHTCEMTTWSLSAHLSLQKGGIQFPNHEEHIIDLVVGDTGSMLAWIYYFLNKEFDKFHPVVSKRLYKELDDRIMNAYLNETRFWWMAINTGPERMVNNWNPWCNSNALQVFLLLENDPERLARGVYKTMVSTDGFINYVKSDGACEEGPSYWGHAAGKLYDYLQILFDATDGKISLFDQPTIKNMGEYISRSYVGNDWVINFADASPKGHFNYRHIYRYGKAVESLEMMQFARYLQDKEPTKIGINRDIYRILADFNLDDKIEQQKPIHSVSPYTWYPETQFCYLNQPKAFFAMKGGNNDESHNHNDVGTFSLYINHSPVFIDAGVGTYTRQTFSRERYTLWYMQSDYHNLPKINGFSQVNGKKYKAENVRFDKNKNIFSLDISKAYPKEAGIDKWTRTYIPKKNSIDIEDSFKVNSLIKNNQINFLTCGNVNIAGDGVINIEADGQKVQFLFDKNQFTPLVETVEIDDPRLSGIWGDKVYRISLNATSSKLSDTYKYSIKY